MSSGDGWTVCAAGHRHWGRFGAAGLLIVDGDKVILQHRAPWTHEGDTWGILGGARNRGEDAVSAALREAGEEAAIDPAVIEPIGLFVDDHNGWAYTTVVARPRREISPSAANAESVSVQWHAVAEVADLPLHTGFAAAWRHLRDVPPPMHLVVTGTAAADPLLAVLNRVGIAADQLPSGMESGGLDRLLPNIVVVPSIDAAAAEAVLLGQDGGQVVVATSAEDLQLLF
jgi:8-oxo-dGTP diphosphatase